MIIKNKIKCYGSCVFINPIFNENNTYKGCVYDIGTTSTIMINIGDMVYYNKDDINSIIIDKDGCESHCIFHTKIFGVEYNDNDNNNIKTYSLPKFEGCDLSKVNLFEGEEI
jgi:hypothetical protein